LKTTTRRKLINEAKKNATPKELHSYLKTKIIKSKVRQLVYRNGDEACRVRDLMQVLGQSQLRDLQKVHWSGQWDSC
jgi:hypothetical protein